MANVSNPLIAALRANSPAPARRASGPVALNYPWMKNTVVPEKSFPNGPPPPPPPAAPPPAAPPPAAPVPATPIPYVAPPPGDEMDQPHWDSLNNDYATAYSNALGGGMTDAQWAATPEFKGFQDNVISGAATTNDRDKLMSDIASMSQGFDNPVYGDNFRKIVAAEQKRLDYLNNVDANPWQSDA